MAKITINPISNNYSINVVNSNYATVALPITASWGPAFEDPASTGKDLKLALEDTVWTRFNATQTGLQNFVSTFRGPAANYRRAKDYSYYIALSLITNGYDVLVCRLCPGSRSDGEFSDSTDFDALTTEPADWETNYTSYFEKSGNDYIHVEGVEVPKYKHIEGEEAPEFVANTYYKLEANEYVLLDEEPADWATNYTSYYIQDGTQVVAPNFVTDKYYKEGDNVLKIQAKYAGTFGNNIVVTIRKVTSGEMKYWNAIVYAVDSTNVRTSLENLVFVFDVDNATDNVLHISEIESNFITFQKYDGLTEESELVGDTGLSTDVPTIRLSGGSDTASQSSSSVSDILLAAQNFAKDRFKLSVKEEDLDSVEYIQQIPNATTDINVAYAIQYREWTFTYATKVLDLLKDKLTYNPNRIISPWDDQNFYELGVADSKAHFGTISPMHIKLMDVAYNSRCATSLLDIPKSLSRDGVWNDSNKDSEEGYVQKLCRYVPAESVNQTGLFTSASALFAPWGQFTYAGTNRQAPASPSFLALMITRAMILNQANQYEWALPTIRSTNFKLSKLDYTVPEDLLMKWQSREGCRLNVITNLPEIGAGIWGNSTLFEVPPATYQALANLSTRYIFNAIQDVVYRVGIGITYQYSNANAYDRFYAGVTPILDTMSNLGALVKGADVPGRTDLDDPGYIVTMSADINGLDSVNANSVIGKIVIRTAGVIEDITIDLIALPQSAALTS